MTRIAGAPWAPISHRFIQKKSSKRFEFFDGLQVTPFADSEMSSKGADGRDLMRKFDVKCPVSIIQVSYYAIKTWNSL